MAKYAIATLKPQEIDGTLEKIKGYAASISPESASILSTRGKHMNMEDTGAEPAHLYTPLNDSYNKVFILKTEAKNLFPTDFTISWLANILTDMGTKSELYIEIVKSQVDPDNKLFSIPFLQNKLPSGNCEIVDDMWIRINSSKDLLSDADKLKTAYGRLHKSFQIFEEEWLRGIQDSDTQAYQEAKRLAEHHYLYSLKGANAKSYLFNRITEDYLGDKSLSCYDMAGGLGFMAAELASTGHTLSVIDFNAKKASVGQRFLKRLQLDTRVNFTKGDARKIGDQQTEYDVIFCFEALYAIGKEYVPEIFRDSMRLLKQGGLLIIMEGALQAGRAPDAPLYDALFSLEELLNCLERNAGEPRFYRYKTGRPISRDDLSEKTSLVAVVKKESGAERKRETVKPHRTDCEGKQNKIWPESQIHPNIKYELQETDDVSYNAPKWSRPITFLLSKKNWKSS
jgi:2-polyprenyl-3-methyl-5-hydroxy-6-metoxy-1,4-benzoquinol methylase